MNNHPQSSTLAPIAVRAILTADDFAHFSEQIESAARERTITCARARFTAALALLGLNAATVRNDMDHREELNGGKIGHEVSYTIGEGAARLRFSNVMPEGETDFPGGMVIEVGQNGAKPEEVSTAHGVGIALALAWSKDAPAAPSESARAAERWAYEHETGTVAERAARARQSEDEMNTEVYDACLRYKLAEASAQLAQFAVCSLGYTRAQVEGIIFGDGSDALEDDRYSASFTAPDDPRLNFYGYLSDAHGETVRDIEKTVTVAVHFDGFTYGPGPVSSLAKLGGIIEDAESAYAAHAAKKSARGAK